MPCRMLVLPDPFGPINTESSRCGENVVPSQERKPSIRTDSRNRGRRALGPCERVAHQSRPGPSTAPRLARAPYPTIVGIVHRMPGRLGAPRVPSLVTGGDCIALRQRTPKICAMGFPFTSAPARLPFIAFGLWVLIACVPDSPPTSTTAYLPLSIGLTRRYSFRAEFNSGRELHGELDSPRLKAQGMSYYAPDIGMVKAIIVRTLSDGLQIKTEMQLLPRAASNTEAGAH